MSDGGPISRKYKLAGFFCLIPHGPTFLFPFFSRGRENAHFVQCGDDNGKISSFSPFDVDNYYLVDAYQRLDATRKIGQDLLYGLRLDEGGLIYGDKTVISDQLMRRASDVSKNPVFWFEAGKFMGDTEIIYEAMNGMSGAFSSQERYSAWRNQAYESLASSGSFNFSFVDRTSRENLLLDPYEDDEWPKEWLERVSHNPQERALYKEGVGWLQRRFIQNRLFMSVWRKIRNERDYNEELYEIAAQILSNYERPAVWLAMWRFVEADYMSLPEFYKGAQAVFQFFIDRLGDTPTNDIEALCKIYSLMAANGREFLELEYLEKLGVTFLSELNNRRYVNKRWLKVWMVLRSIARSSVLNSEYFIDIALKKMSSDGMTSRLGGQIWLSIILDGHRDEEITELGFRYLEQAPKNMNVWAQVWERLWSWRYRTEEVFELGHEWLEVSHPEIKSWPKMFKMVWEGTAYRQRLVNIGEAWLSKVQHQEHAHVVESLISSEKHKFS